MIHHLWTILIACVLLALVIDTVRHSRLGVVLLQGLAFFGCLSIFSYLFL